MPRKPPAHDIDEDQLKVRHAKDHAAGPTAVAVTMKRAIEQFAQAEPDIPAIRQNMRECATSEDLREGLAALRERRPPDFKGC